MTSAWILIVAILLLGGIIAVLGDRLGTKVGKARLRLFNLRPRQTAMVVTILTGTMISASTLGILFGLSESLRKGVFQLDDILKELRTFKQELEQTTQEKQQVEAQLSTVKAQRVEAQQKLDQINRDYNQAQTQLRTISEQANKLRIELDTLLKERQKQLQQLNQLQEQSSQLQSQLQEREQDIIAQDQILQEKETRLQQLQRQQEVLQEAIEERDRRIVQLDEAIATKDGALQAKETQLGQLESQLSFLEREVAILEQYYQVYHELRERKIAVVKGQVLASATIRILEPNAAISAIERVLRQANSNAIKAVNPGKEYDSQRLVNITKAQVEQLAAQIQDGRDYVIRIISAGNYVQGEQEVRVFADLALNKEIFRAGEEIATVSIDSENMEHQEIQERLDWLLAASKFRAQRAGILGDLQIGNGQIATLINFIDEVATVKEPLDEIKAVVAETTYTAGPLKLNLVVMRDGKIILST
ncbi:DUF3084 domain-containing protein [Pleurocapsales cyanobacterium LEGE 06147]|nr:DUF3084 domain-containing protein [Pleurocapsales cyanobacterium LEGE 06147]